MAVAILIGKRSPEVTCVRGAGSSEGEKIRSLGEPFSQISQNFRKTLHEITDLRFPNDTGKMIFRFEILPSHLAENSEA
jgi:hypothetical protein